MQYCAMPGCSMLVTRGRCVKHAIPTAQGWTQDTGRIRGRELQRLRMQLFRDEPFCRVCVQAGQRTVATIRDHIIPRTEGGTEDDNNIQPMCESCHQVKIREESKRGMWRAR